MIPQTAVLKFQSNGLLFNRLRLFLIFYFYFVLFFVQKFQPVVFVFISIDDNKTLTTRYIASCTVYGDWLGGREKGRI